MTSARPWAYAEAGAVRTRRAERYSRDARAEAEQRDWEAWKVSDDQPSRSALAVANEVDDKLNGAPELPTARPTKKGGGGLFGKIAGLAGDGIAEFGDLAMAGGKGVLKGIDALAEYGGEPAMGIAFGANATRTYTDANGKRYKKAGEVGIGELLSSWKEAATHPVRAYEKGRESTDEYFANPELNPAFREVGKATANPLSYVGGAGAAKVVGKAGLTGAPATGAKMLLDSGGGRVVLGAAAATGAEDQFGDEVPGWNRVPQGARSLIAGTAGAIAGGRTMPRAPKSALVREDAEHADRYFEMAQRRGIEIGMGEDGELVVMNPDEARRIADDLERGVAESALPFVNPGTQAQGHFGDEISTFIDANGNRVTKGYDERGPAPVRGSHRVEKPGELTPELHQDLADSQRIREMLDDERYFWDAEGRRTPLAAGVELAGFEAPSAEKVAELEGRWKNAGRRPKRGDRVEDLKPSPTSKEGQRLGQQLGQARARRFAADRIERGDMSAQAIASEIDVELDNISQFRGQLPGEEELRPRFSPKDRLSFVDRAYVAQLREIRDALLEDGDRLARPKRPAVDLGPDDLDVPIGPPKPYILGTTPPPPTTTKGMRFKHFGDGDYYDIIGAMPRHAQVTKQREYLESMRGKLNQGLRQFAKGLGAEKISGDKNLVLDTLVRPFVVGERDRTKNVIGHWASSVRERAESKMKQAGLAVAKASDGTYRINGDASMPTINDLVERSTPEARKLYESLSPAQREAIDYVEWANEAVSKTANAHRVEMPIDPNIEGTYFPRKVMAIGGVDRTSGGSSFRKSRTQESLEAGVTRSKDAGGEIVYDNPWDSFEAGLKGKLNTIQDGYLANMLRPLALDPKVAAAKGIRDGFGARYLDLPGVPQGRYGKGLLFEADVADRIENALIDRPKDNFFSAFPKAVNAILTPLRATGDFSATLQQGMVSWLTNPVRASRTWLATMHSLYDSDVYYKALDNLDGAGPGVAQHSTWGARYAAADAKDEFLLPKVAAVLSKGKFQEIPVLGTIARKSNEHFARFLNLTRYQLGNDAYERAIKRGLQGQALDNEMRGAWNSINRATGWTGRQPTTLEAIGVFAPKYFSASIEQIHAAVSKGGMEGALARRHLLTLIGAAAGMTWAINTARGQETEFDPRSSNFLRIKNVGGLDVSIVGTYDTLTRALANTIAGNGGLPETAGLYKLAQSKMSPALKIPWEIWKEQETYLGEPLEPDFTKAGFYTKTIPHQAKSSVPFNVQDLIEEGPLAAAAGSTGLSARLRSETEKLAQSRDDEARRQFGRNYGDLTGEEKSKVNETAGVAERQASKDAQDVRKGGDTAARVRLRQDTAKRMAANARYLAAGENDAGEAFGGREYRSAYNELQDQVKGARSMLGDFKGDKEVDGWFNLFDKAAMENGQTDYDKLDVLQAAYREKHPDIDEKVAEITGIHDDATMRELRQAQALARQYYDKPAYRFMSKADAEKAREGIRRAQIMVSKGEARNVDAALRMLPDGEMAALARMAQRTGTNPERTAFRRAPENAVFAKFYG